MRALRGVLVVALAVTLAGACAPGPPEGAGQESTPAAVAPAARRSAPTSVRSSIPPAPDRADVVTLFPLPFTTAPLARAPDGPVPAPLARALQRAVDRAAAPRSTEGIAFDGGISAAVISPHGRWSGASGSAGDGVALTPQHVFAAGRLTQPVVAAQVMRLVEDGVLGLDDPAREHLPGTLAGAVGEATVRELLGMRSGLRDVDKAWYTAELRAEPARTWEPADLLRAATPAQTRRRPGQDVAYSGTNYVLLGKLLEHVTGRPLAAVLRSGVLADPALGSLAVQPDEVVTGPAARDVDAAPSGGPLPSQAVVSALGGARALAGDPAGLARWWQRLGGGRVISRTSLSEMAAFPGDGAQTLRSYGLGLMDLSEVADVPAVGYADTLPLARAWAYCQPVDGVVVVVMTNDGLGDELLRLVAELATLTGRG
ncbi:serine hydrolase domain-containing protein [Georgenia yuyongxinii]|uniref:Beta-lactamase family protein n=1 Tax=Georgenia yuyongxinii TaxID=2589797 RepID=A0A552WJ41_9MICO|nr:serine hydrolase domain-containing protein [Georgenia yuyongxinii]TRW42781.1 beta-lactamase family protein [Georgenia yuyongxinii]